MKQIVLEKIVISAFPPVNKRCLWLNGNTFMYWYGGMWRSIDSEIDINEEYIDKKVSETVTEEITTILGDAPEEFDTLSEVAEYLTTHETEAAKRGEDISTNASAIEELKEKVESLEDSGSGGNSG